jgi:hypothetical protein
MPRRNSIALILSLLFVLPGIVVGGCHGKDGEKKKRVEPSLEVPDFDAHDWPDAMRLSNGWLNVIVVPSVGRVMRFGFPDAPNVLWTNPNHRPPRLGESMEDKPVSPESADPTQLARKNFGGDRAWPWPQDQWPQYLGRTWPPPPELDQMPMRARLVGPLGVQLQSDIVRGYNVRLKRQITLDPKAPRATLLTRFERATGELPPVELAAWQITQVPAIEGSTVYAKLALGGQVIGLAPSPFDAHHEVGPGVIALDPPDTRAGKWGIDADVLAWTAGEILLVARSHPASTESTQFRAGERAQVYVAGAPDPERPNPNTPTRYFELEFTSPRKDLARDQTPELMVTWELYRNEGGKFADADVVAVLTGARRTTADQREQREAK